MTIVWIAVGYLIGTIPSAWIVAHLAHATGHLDVDRTESARDAHIAIAEELGMAWAITAGTADVVKAFVYILVLREILEVGSTDVAWAGVAVVVGYAFPFYAERYAGRGLAAASGVLLAAVPVAMIVAGLTIVVGRLLRHTGVASTIGMASTPFVAAARGAPDSTVLMAVAIFAVLMLRRAEGVSRSFETRAQRAAEILRRIIFDTGS